MLRDKTEQSVGTASAPVTAPAARPARGAEFTVKARTQRQIVLGNFRRHRGAMVSLVVFVLVVLFGYLGPLVWNKSTSDISYDIFFAPSASHPFGTDANGIDYLASVMHGTQRSLQIAVLTAVVATAFGTAYGATAGFYGGWVDTLMMRFADVVLTIPALVIGIVLTNSLGSSASKWYLLMLVLSALFWPYPARIVRSQVLSLKEKEFIEAARALGANDRRIIFRHLVPNCLGSIIVVLTLLVAGTILVETALSYLGFGVKFPDTSLGTLVTTNQTAIEGGHPWLFYFPGVFIILIALTINFIGDGLRDAFDPNQTRVRA